MHLDFRTIRKTFLMVVAAAILAGCATSKPLHWTAPAPSPDPYPLDDEPRKTRECPNVQMHEYEGDVLTYERPVKVNPFFRERLQQFELVVQQVSQRRYGTGEVVIRHFGTLNCRTIRGRNKLSEHAFANAIDISGFDIQHGDSTTRIVIAHHWWGGDHRAAFLHELAIALAARPDIFRGILGPGDPDHEDHLHLDAGAHRYIDVHVR